MKRLLKQFSLVLIVVALLGVLGISTAQAQSTDWTVIVPNALFFYYFDQFAVTLQPTDFGVGALPFYQPMGGGALPGLGTYDLAPLVPAPVPVTDGTLTLQNAWAVYAIVAVGQQVQVSIAATDGSLQEPSGTCGNLLLGSTLLDVTTNGGAFGGTGAVTFAAPGLGTAQMGDTTLSVNWAGVTCSGTYGGGDNNEITYTVSVI